MPKRHTCGIILRDPASIWALLFQKRWTNEQVMSKGRNKPQPDGWEAIEKSSNEMLVRLGCDTGKAKELLLNMQPSLNGSKASIAQMQSSAKSSAANETPSRCTRRSAANLHQPSTPGAGASLVTIAAASTSPSACEISVPAASRSKATNCSVIAQKVSLPQSSRPPNLNPY